MAGSKKTSASAAKSSNGQGSETSEADIDLGAAASEVTEQIQDQVTGLTQQVRQQASEQLVTQKERLVDTLDTVALVLHQAGEHADLQDKAMLTQYVDKASSQVSQWSDTLRERDMSQLLDDTVRYARRQPMLFFSGALAAGFAGARFFRSSAKQAETTPANGTVPDSGVAASDTALDTDESAANDIPRFESDQAAFDSALGAANSPLDTDMSMQTDREPEFGDFVEDYKAATQEGDELIDDSLAGTNRSTSPENR
ncbi:MAG: hypothetical protein H0V37_10295 [Chloroflexia bacterium]|nr:hypothetical protein [Chloroflexia bacterium]MBA2469783.1 hypothetical protein [Chloroflexia bacterium]